VNVRRQVELVWYPMTEMSVDLPDHAQIVAVDFYDQHGLLQGRRPAGVWVAVTIDRWDEDHPERLLGSSYPAEPLPPPERNP
jgi:hypothetical protein